MAAFEMRRRTPTEAESLDDFQRNPPLRRNLLTYGTARQFGFKAASWRALRVLVVGDEQDKTHKLVQLVRRSGHVAYAAYDGLAAFRVAADQQPNVVLLNLELQLISGRQVARQMRLDFPRKECFIIAIADQADDERRRQSSAAGIDLVLVKPIAAFLVETLLMLECVRVNQQRTSRANVVRKSRRVSRGSSC